jgi:hypothetical protein
MDSLQSFQYIFLYKLYLIKSHALPSVSQSPDEERQTVEEDTNESEGHEAELPVHFSSNVSVVFRGNYR